MIETIISPLSAHALNFVASIIPGVISNKLYDEFTQKSVHVDKTLRNPSSIEQLPEHLYLQRAAYRAYLGTCQRLLSLEGYVNPTQRAANPHGQGQLHVLKELANALKQINSNNWQAHLPQSQPFAEAQKLVTNVLSDNASISATAPTSANSSISDANGANGATVVTSMTGAASSPQPASSAALPPQVAELEQWLSNYALKDMTNRALDANLTLPTNSLIKRFNDPHTGFIAVYKHFLGDEINNGDPEFFNTFVSKALATTNTQLANATNTLNTLQAAIVEEIRAITPMVITEFQTVSVQISQHTTEQAHKLDEISELQREIINILGTQKHMGISTHSSLAHNPPSPQPNLDEPPKQTSITHYTQQAFEVIGRDKEQDILRAFLQAPKDKNGHLKWLQIAGQAGQGKSRLAFELILEAKNIEQPDTPKWAAGMLDKPSLQAFLEFADTWQPQRPHLMVFDYIVGYEAPIAKLLQTLTQRRNQFHYPIRILLVERQAWNKGGLVRQATNTVGLNASATKSQQAAKPKQIEHQSAQINRDLDLHVSQGQGNAEWYEKLAAEGFTYLNETRFDSGSGSGSDSILGVVELGQLSQTQLVTLCKQVAHTVNANANLSNENIEAQLAHIDPSGRPLYAYFLGQALAQTPSARYHSKEHLLDQILEHEYRQRWLPAVQQLHAEQALPETITLAGETIHFSEESAAQRFTIMACIVRAIDTKQLAQLTNGSNPNPVEVQLAQKFNDNPAKVARITIPRYVAGLQPDLLGEYLALIKLGELINLHPLWQHCWAFSPRETAAFLLRISQDFATHEVTQTLLSIAPDNNHGATTLEALDALDNVATDILVALQNANLHFPSNIIKALERTANLGNAAAMFNLGLCYQQGNGLEQDLTKANELFQQVVDLDNKGNKNSDNVKARAMLNLAVNYENGNGLEQDFTKANQLYQQATDLGDDNVKAKAMFYLAINHKQGNGIEQNFTKANQLYQQAADLGDDNVKASAMLNLAVNYENDDSVKQDFTKANQLYQQALDFSDDNNNVKAIKARAMFNLALNYQQGNGLEQDVTKAIKLLQQAAELGNQNAINILDSISD